MKSLDGLADLRWLFDDHPALVLLDHGFDVSDLMTGHDKEVAGV